MAASNSRYGHLAHVEPEYEPVLRQIKDAFDALWNLPLPELRAQMQSAPVQLPEDIPKDLIIEDRKVPVSDGTELEIRSYSSPKRSKSSVLYYVCHGGGWVVGDHATEEVQLRAVAGRNDALVISVLYRCAPEFPYPTPFNDCFDVLKWCKQNANDLGIDPEKIVLGGGSAGGNLAAVLSLRARDEGLSGIIGQVLNVPVTCHPDHFPKDKYEFTSWEQNAQAPLLDAKVMRWFWDCYKATTEEYASPLLAKSLHGLPPALVQVAGLDPLRDEGLAYAEALKAAGVRTQLEVFPGMPHAFCLFPVFVEEVAKFLQNIVDFINKVSSE
jgi:acetyl esterase/lipase